MYRLRTAVLSLLTLVLGASMALAQEPAPTSGVVDRVVAVVGDSIILRTDLEEEVFRIVASTGQPLPEDPTVVQRLYEQALEARINELLLLQAAQRDSVVADDAMITQSLEQELARRRQAIGGERAFQAALREQGMTLNEFRDDMKAQLERQFIIEMYISQLQRERQPPPVTDAEAKEHFDANREQIARRPATLTFEQVIVQPQPTDSARAAARAEAEEILEKLRKGEKFEDMARRHTDEPGGRERAGDLGWFRRGQMVQEFERVAFSLPPGSISNVVETSFGYHIIKVEKARGGERQARHILIRPEMTQEDYQRTQEIAREVAERMRAGEPIDSLVAEYGDASLQSPGSLLGPRVGPIRRDRLSELPGPYATALSGAEEGVILEPFRLTGVGEGNHWVVAKVTEVTDESDYTWDDPEVRSRIREQLERQKLMDEIIGDLRGRTYIDIRR